MGLCILGDSCLIMWMGLIKLSYCTLLQCPYPARAARAVIFDYGDTMTDCPKVAATARVPLCNSTYVSGQFVFRGIVAQRRTNLR
jgi:hypothetical protein